MSDIFREVDEALSREKAERFWKEYGPTLVLAVIVLLLSTAAVTAYESWDSWRNREETSKLVAAQGAADPAAAFETVAEETRGSQAAVALLSAANKYAADKKFDKARPLYDKVAANKGAPQALRDLAVILSVRTILIENKSPNYQALAKALASIANSGKSPYAPQAALDMALLQGDGLKQYDAALETLKKLEGDAIPAAIKEKAEALIHVYTEEKAGSQTIAPAAQAAAKKE